MSVFLSSIYLSVYLLSCPLVHFSISSCVDLSKCLSVYLSRCIHIFMPICLCLSIYMVVYVFTMPSLFLLQTSCIYSVFMCISSCIHTYMFCEWALRVFGDFSRTASKTKILCVVSKFETTPTTTVTSNSTSTPTTTTASLSSRTVDSLKVGIPKSRCTNYQYQAQSATNTDAYSTRTRTKTRSLTETLTRMHIRILTVIRSGLHYKSIPLKVYC